MKPTSGRSSSSASWWTDRRPIPARAGTGPSGTPRVTRRVIGRYIAFGATTLPPIFSHSPFGTYFHSFGSLLVFAWPAQECAGLAQSFLPASATPAHLSLAAASSAEAVALPNASRLPMAEAMAMVFRFMRLLRSCLWMLLVDRLSRPEAGEIYFVSVSHEANFRNAGDTACSPGARTWATPGTVDPESGPVVSAQSDIWLFCYRHRTSWCAQKGIRRGMNDLFGRNFMLFALN